MRGANNFMLGSNKSYMDQAISMREAQVRIGVNVPRQRSDHQNHSYYNNNSNNFNNNYRGSNRGRGFQNNNRGRGGYNNQNGQQYHQQVQQYSNPAPNSGPGNKEQ
jgi:hypothetical protein